MPIITTGASPSSRLSRSWCHVDSAGDRGRLVDLAECRLASDLDHDLDVSDLRVHAPLLSCRREVRESLSAGFRNEKHKAQWKSTLETYAAPLRTKPLDVIALHPDRRAFRGNPRDALV